MEAAGDDQCKIRQIHTAGKLRVPGRALGRWAGEAGEEGSGGRWHEERVASGGVIFKDPGFTDVVHSGEEPTVPTPGATTQRAIE